MFLYYNAALLDFGADWDAKKSPQQVIELPVATMLQAWVQLDKIGYHPIRTIKLNVLCKALTYQLDSG